MNCIEGATQLIDQIISTLEQISSDDYSRPLEIYNGSTMGKHFRHIYDFFNCLVIQYDQVDIDYCLRGRDERIESDVFHSIQSFHKLKNDIGTLNEAKEITVHADFEIKNGVRPIVKTSIGREIMYAYDHAVHHLAIVKIGLKAIRPDLKINQDLGVAASTLRHQHIHG